MRHSRCKVFFFYILYVNIPKTHGVCVGVCLKKQMSKWHLGFFTWSTLLMRYYIIKVDNIWHPLTFSDLHTLPGNFLMTPSVGSSQRKEEEASWFSVIFRLFRFCCSFLFSEPFCPSVASLSLSLSLSNFVFLLLFWHGFCLPPVHPPL